MASSSWSWSSMRSRTQLCSRLAMSSSSSQFCRRSAAIATATADCTCRSCRIEPPSVFPRDLALAAVILGRGHWRAPRWRFEEARPEVPGTIPAKLRHINTRCQYFRKGRTWRRPDLGLHLCCNLILRGSADVNTGRRERQEAGGFAARLRQVLKTHGSASGLAKAIARSEGAVRKWLRGESEPNVTDLRTLCLVTQTRIEWLVSGEGPREAAAQSSADTLVRESAPPYRHPSHGTLDLPLLEAVMAAVDEQLRVAGLDLSPAKRSALVAAAYDLARERNAVGAEAVARLVRLAH